MFVMSLLKPIVSFGKFQCFSGFYFLKHKNKPWAWHVELLVVLKAGSRASTNGNIYDLFS